MLFRGDAKNARQENAGLENASLSKLLCAELTEIFDKKPL